MKTLVSAGTAFLVAVGISVSVAQAAAVAAPGAFVPVQSTRVLDTRAGIGAPAAKVAAGATLTFDAAPGLPSSASSLVLNVTEVAPTQHGFLTVFAAAGTRSIGSSLNFAVGQTVPNMVVVKVAADHRVSIYNGSRGTIDLLADISGYFAGGTAAESGTFVPLAKSVRVLDTRIGVGLRKGVVGARSTSTFTVGGAAGVPADASSVVLNLTAVNPVKNGFLTAFPAGTEVPTASTVTYYPQQNTAGLTLVELGAGSAAGGVLSVYNGSAGTVDLVADVTGYFIGGEQQVDGTFVPIGPYRALDTRLDPGKPVPAQLTARVQILPAANPGETSPFKAAAIHVTAANPQSSGFFTTWQGAGGLPSVSNVNFVRGRNAAGSVIVPVNPDGTIAVYNGSGGNVDLIIDVTGFFFNLPTATEAPGHAGLTPAQRASAHAKVVAAVASLKGFKTAATPKSLTHTTR